MSWRLRVCSVGGIGKPPEVTSVATLRYLRSWFQIVVWQKTPRYRTPRQWQCRRETSCPKEGSWNGRRHCTVEPVSLEKSKLAPLSQLQCWWKVKPDFAHINQWTDMTRTWMIKHVCHNLSTAERRLGGVSWKILAHSVSSQWGMKLYLYSIIVIVH